MLAPTLAASAQTRADLERNNAELEQAREELEDTEQRRKATLADLEEIEARRAQIQAELSALNRTLAAAEARLGDVRAKLAATTGELRSAEARLEETRRELERNRELFGARARESYKRGNAGYGVFTMRPNDVHDFARALKYVERVMEHDRDRITHIASLEREVTAKTESLAGLRERQEALALVASRERDEVAALVADQRVLHDRAAEEAERHRLALADIESDRDSYRELVASLERESAQLEAELRRRAEEDRRRREAAAARGGSDEQEQEQAREGRLLRPHDGPRTSSYGWRTHPIYGERRFHSGIDYAGPTGDDFWAAGDGVVVSAGWRGGYGNAVVIDHGGGLATLYAHASALVVRSGQRVTRGQVIGRVGSTGYSTGPHLHFEVREDGEPKNPDNYL